MDGQCGKLVRVVGHQFITLTVDICVQHGGREALRRAGLSAAAETSSGIVRKNRQTHKHRRKPYPPPRLPSEWVICGQRISMKGRIEGRIFHGGQCNVTLNSLRALQSAAAVALLCRY